MLREKAIEIVASYRTDNFSPSNEWIPRLKILHELISRKLCGENTAASNTEKTEDQKTSKITIWYNDCDIYNAGEALCLLTALTALFYKFLSEITLAFKRETCHGIIHGITHGHSLKDSQWCYAELRVILTKEYVLLVIGKYTRLRCFNYVKKLPVLYHSDTKVRMKMTFFTKSFYDYDRSIKERGGVQKSKIILFIDICSASQLNALSLKNTEVSFSPAKCISFLYWIYIPWLYIYPLIPG